VIENAVEIVRSADQPAVLSSTFPIRRLPEVDPYALLIRVN
jgi:hypothetical protein